MAPSKVPEKKKGPRAWDALTPPLADWILDAVSSMGFAQMTPVQAATLPLFLGNKDVVVEASFSFPFYYLLSSQLMSARLTFSFMGACRQSLVVGKHCLS